MTDLTSRLSKCYASAIHDVLREKGYGNCVLPPEIQALEKGPFSKACISGGRTQFPYPFSLRTS